jgi:hypothetical protein
LSFSQVPSDDFVKTKLKFRLRVMNRPEGTSLALTIALPILARSITVDE